MSGDPLRYSAPAMPITLGPTPPNIGRPVLRVPLAGPTNLLQRPHVAIRFRNVREGSRSRGASLSDLFRAASEPPTLDAEEDIVLYGVGGPRREVKFVINWPGYTPERFIISTASTNGGPLTRCELGRSVMHAYGNFFRKVVTQRILPSGPSVDRSFRIALHQTPETRTSDWAGIRFSQLHLVKFREPVPGDDHWIAEIDIVPGY